MRKIVQEGPVYTVRGAPRPVTGPATGNLIGTLPGAAKGRIEITEIKAQSSRGRILPGSAET